MKIAIPTFNKQLTTHFGHCENFAIVETDGDKVSEAKYITPPVHQPGVYPQFLAEMGVKVIIAGGMGVQAQELFRSNNIEVCVGVNPDTPENLAKQYLENKLQTGSNQCSH
ncbi:MAG: NifB/NifX family molybdenum-iron cluster-binding protein [Bacteroidales bacterium]